MGALNRIWVLALLVFSATSHAVERYREAVVDDRGVLQILTEDGRRVIAEPEPALETGPSVGLHQVRIAPDRRAVGWLVKYPNCCTSYPIPLTLVVYFDGVRRTYRGSGLPIWDWRFLAGGNQVAFRQETVHGGIGTRFELHDVRSGDPIDAFDWPVGPDNQFLADPVLPPWVQAMAKEAPMDVPAAFVGRWTNTPPPCENFATEGMLEITDRSVALYAAGGPIRAVRSSRVDTLDLLLKLYGEDGQEHSEWMQLRLSADGSRLQREGVDTEYVRCQAP